MTHIDHIQAGVNAAAWLPFIFSDCLFTLQALIVFVLMSSSLSGVLGHLSIQWSFKNSSLKKYFSHNLSQTAFLDLKSYAQIGINFHTIYLICFKIHLKHQLQQLHLPISLVSFKPTKAQFPIRARLFCQTNAKWWTL